MNFSDPYFILILIGATVIVSYIFFFLSLKIKIPSVLLLISLGVGLKVLAGNVGINIPIPAQLIETLGIIGLIMIVLEGCLDLSISGEKFTLIAKAFISALIGVVVFTTVLTICIVNVIEVPIHNALAYSIPFGVISSAIAIPSVAHLSEHKREFVVYESAFSDIIGIVLFNYVSQVEVRSVVGYIGRVFVDSVGIVAITVAFLLLLFYLHRILRYSKRGYFLYISILLVTYSLSKLLHLPSLILVVVLGLVLNNLDRMQKYNFLSYSHRGQIEGSLEQFRYMTAEFSFFIRTFFFVFFGYNMEFGYFYDVNVWMWASVIIGSIFVIRFTGLTALRTNNTLLTAISPRGLITILLLFSIPQALQIPQLNNGILFLVIIGTNLIMMTGLVLNRKN